MVKNENDHHPSTFSPKFLGSVTPGIFLILASYMECDRNTVVIMFVLSMFSMGPYYPSLRITPADISKNFAGIIMAFVNGIGALSYIPVPSITAAITPDVSNFYFFVILLLNICFKEKLIFLFSAYRGTVESNFLFDWLSSCCNKLCLYNLGKSWKIAVWYGGVDKYFNNRRIKSLAAFYFKNIMF